MDQRRLINEDFILTNQMGKQLYFKYAADLPIIDYHCHIIPEEIAKDREFENIFQVWLGGDHYKWRLIRAFGIDEQLITGDADPKDKFMMFAGSISECIGNPVYHWAHLELARYFNYNRVLDLKTAEEAWEQCNKEIVCKKLSPRKIIKASNVEVICTTDDPLDDLSAHKKCASDDSLAVGVYPSFRPDKIININKDGFIDYLHDMEVISDIKINNLDKLKKALRSRMDHFDKVGCKISDHGLDRIPYSNDISSNRANEIFIKKIEGKLLSDDEELAYMNHLLIFLGREYCKRNWIMQIHYGVNRNVNERGFRMLGPDTGFDCIMTEDNSKALANLLSKMDMEKTLPKTILYSIDANDLSMLATVAGSFSKTGVKNYVQVGVPWWFNDSKKGIETYFDVMSELMPLGNIVGMLTDSRSFLSYTRHEYFRRILCNWIGSKVEKNEYPNDEEMLKKIIRNISYYNAKDYFEF